MSVADIGTLDRVLIVGSFFRKDHPLIAQRVRQAVKKGMKVSAINPAFDDWQLPIANKLVVSPDQMSRRLLGILKALSDQKGVEVSPVFGEAMGDAVIDDGVLAVAGALHQVAGLPFGWAILQYSMAMPPISISWLKRSHVFPARGLVFSVKRQIVLVATLRELYPSGS
jgi:hypothetical protein